LNASVGDLSMTCCVDPLKHADHTQSTHTPHAALVLVYGIETDGLAYTLTS